MPNLPNDLSSMLIRHMFNLIVFEEVMVESKRLAEEQRAGRIPRPDRFPSSTTYDNSPGTSSSGSRMDDDLKGVSMSGFENEGKVFAGENPDGAERRRELEREGQVGTSGRSTSHVTRPGVW